MKKIILFLVFVLMASVVTGAHSLLLSEDTKFAIYGDVVNDYNEGIFTIDKGVTGTFELEVEETTESNYSIYFTNQDTGKEYQCLSYNLSNANDTVYDVCTIYPESIGTYTVDLRIDNIEDHAQTFYVENASPSALFWFLGISGVIAGLFAMYYLRPVFILAVLLILGAFTNLLFTYSYLLENDLFVGFIGILIAGLISGIILILKYFIEE